ncbi:MAG: cyclic nucleotide-binding domain-containing protein [endosymbiont of Galathealinum brachiosum]|uniref:Cyclic nucleotide-binding domain-containing protein n=1 Tax=endosymbiont of Galathealinum brachiosum TaxID=2200906 RepID=A0A370DAL8_9GAMM|nr:MAG: cyclic nucleotide-binding domain-containing protein [endosymbiont of Galathealinum brachiosum]
MGLIKTPSSEDELANSLELTNWAKDFSWHQICTISKHMEAYTATKGTVIFDEGSEDNTMAIVIKGKIDIIKRESGSKVNIIASIFPSQSFGEMSLIDGEARSAQAIASTDVDMLFLSKDKLFGLLEDSPKLAFKLLLIISQMLSQRLRRTSGNLVAQLNKD